MSQKQRVAVLGASKNKERYSYKAFSMLKEHGHDPIPVHPVLKELEGVPVAPGLEAIHGPVDTLTVYVGPKHITAEIPKIVALRPGRVILNPGTESPELEQALDAAGIPYMEACTLVLLSTAQF
ncbi:MAG: CoA-binding protein [Spirochaetales bacterium]|nr:CoA-binding protein [Spirochaetales bacterium]